MKGFDPDALEKGVLDRWAREQTFAKSVNRRKDAPRYSFYDGPPYATGSPHYGNILQQVIKDTVTRYWTMRGHRVDRRVGWDCHGLPVEHMVEKELGIKMKREIEDKGIEAFNAACRAAVLRRVDEWTTLLRRVGRWADYAGAYRTMDASFIESAWWVFKTAWDRGLIYKGARSSPYCPRCETTLSNFETSQGYTDVVDPEITVKMRLLKEESTYLLVWTTTPWTLPGNAAVAVHPDVRYVRVRVGDERWIVAKDRVPDVVREEYALEDEFLGSVMVEWKYEPLYTFLTPDKPAYRVVAGTFVSATEGTGLVHIAPAFGEEDFRLAEEMDLPLLRTVDSSGRFIAAVTPWAGQRGRDADEAIMQDLQNTGKLLARGTIQHAYPHCWRCETPLIYLATDSWFLAVTTIKNQLLENAEQITWVPAHLKEGRFGQGLRDAPDWAVSRERFWGVPLPVWVCTACDQPTVVGSLNDLTAAGGDVALLKSPSADPDLHRPYVDRVILRCAHCGREARRVPEVLDVWFDSGSMPYGQWHYPFENRQLVEATFPADFVGEALEMTRGWFYTLHVLAGIVTLQDSGLGVNRAAFKHVVASGLILAEDGRKLSKRLGNYPDPAGIIAKYGADTLRLYLLSATRIGEDMQFSDRLVGELYRRFTLILWNVWQFFRTYGAEENAKRKTQNAKQNLEPKDLPLLDRWVLARTAKLTADVRAAMNAYHIDDAARALVPFMEDLSTWYVRRSRGREDALPVLREVLRQFSIIAAPFIPFLSEHIHQELTGTSPHLEDFPSTKLSSTDSGLLTDMAILRDQVAAAHRLRKERGYKLRQPLLSLASVGVPPKFGDPEWKDLLKSETNVKDVVVNPREPSGFDPLYEFRGGMSTAFAAAPLTDELKQEGIVRDLIRVVQDLRRQAGYQFDDLVTLSIDTDSAAVRAAIERFASQIQSETKSRELRFSRDDGDAATDISLGGASLRVSVKK